MRKREAGANSKSGRARDELNLAEFPLSLIGKRAPGGAKTIYFEDEVWDKGAKRMVPRKLTITASDLLGLPTAIDDEVLVGCLKLSKDEGFQSPQVQFTPYEFLELLGWSRDGKSYRRLSQSFDRWAGTLVISDNAFWNKGKQRWVKDTINIIDRARFYRGGEEVKDGTGKKSFFVWGSFMWESLESGNVRSLDFDFWKGLERPISKRLFRLLEKRFYLRGEVTFPLKTLAFEKVGLSRNMHTGQVKAKLTPSHEELLEKGFCQSEYVTRAPGDWQVVYTDLRKKGKKASVQVASPLQKALEERGIKNAAELVARAPGKRIHEAIENYDDRRAHGEDVGPGWLGKCISHSTGFSFRKGYVSKQEQLKSAAKAKEKCKAEQAERDKEATTKRNAELQRRKAFESFLTSLGDDEAEEEYLVRALAATPIYPNLISQCEARGDHDSARRHRRDAMRLLWEKELKAA